VKVDDYIREMERTMPVPPTAFPWQDTENPHEWTEEIYALMDYLKEKSKGQSSIIYVPSVSFAGSMDSGRYWKAAYAALAYVVATCPPCSGALLKSHVLDVLEAAQPNEDDFHAEVMGRFNEAAHVVMTKERYGH